MKTKRLSKKLRLNKQTIVSLNDLEMIRLRGGKLWTDSCDTIYPCETINTCECRTDGCV